MGNTTRGFARSDDGGATWAEIWNLFERQPELSLAPCSDALVYSPRTGAMYFARGRGPVGSNPNNLAILRSKDEGASWSFLDVVFESGADYLDMTLVPGSSSESGDLLGIAFQRELHITKPSLEGGGYNIAWALVWVPAEPSSLFV